MTSLRQGVLGHLLDFLGFALVEVLVHQGVVGHLLLRVARASRPRFIFSIDAGEMPAPRQTCASLLPLNCSSASSIATMFCLGMPGLVPPPTERIIPLSSPAVP